MFLLSIVLTSIAIVPAFAQVIDPGFGYGDFDFTNPGLGYNDFGDIGSEGSLPTNFLAETPSVFDQIIGLISGFLN